MDAVRAKRQPSQHLPPEPILRLHSARIQQRNQGGFISSQVWWWSALARVFNHDTLKFRKGRRSASTPPAAARPNLPPAGGSPAPW